MKAFAYLALVGMLASETQGLKLRFDESEVPTESDNVLTQTDGSLIVLKAAKDDKDGNDADKDGQDGGQGYDVSHHAKESSELDKFFIPNQYTPPVEDIYNTHHGYLPLQAPASHNEAEPTDEDTKFYNLFAGSAAESPKYEHLHF